MTDFENTLIDSTKDLMSELMNRLSIIESVELIKDFVTQGEVVIMLPDGSIKKLAVLPVESLGYVKTAILSQLDYELSDSLTRLKYITDAHSNYTVDFGPTEASESATEAPEEASAIIPEKRQKNRQGAKLEIDIKDVMKLRAAGWSLKKIADKYGCAEQTILNRITKHENAQAETARRLAR